jgi:hypothetical protein
MSSFTQAQLDALTAAIAQGATTVEYQGRRVTYRSVKDMLALRDRMMNDLQNQPPNIARPVAHFSVFLHR